MALCLCGISEIMKQCISASKSVSCAFPWAVCLLFVLSDSDLSLVFYILFYYYIFNVCLFSKGDRKGGNAVKN